MCSQPCFLFSFLFCSSDTEFSITLNRKDALTEDQKTLASYGIVSGDLICLLLEEADGQPSLPPLPPPAPALLENGHEPSTLIPNKNQANSPIEEGRNEQSDNQKALVTVHKSDERVSTRELPCTTQGKKEGTFLCQLLYYIVENLFRIFSSLYLPDM